MGQTASNWAELYDLLSDETAPEHLAKVLIEAGGSRWGAVALERAEGPVEIISAAPFPGLNEAYCSHYAERDPWRVQRPRLYDQALDSASFVSEAQWRNSELYNDLLKPHGIEPEHTIIAAIRLDAGVEAVIGLGRSRADGQITEDNLRAVTEALPHLRRVLKVRDRLRDAEVTTAFSDAALDAFPHAIFRLNAAGTVVHQNRSATQLLDRADGVCSRSGKLALVNDEADEAMQAAVHRAIHRTGSVASMVSAPRNGSTPLVLMFAPISRRGESQVLVIGHAPEFEAGARHTQMAGLFRLSAAEVDLATGLLEGRSLQEIAELRHTSINTLRVQLRSILKKTGASRQAELVAMLARYPVLRSDG